MSNDGDNDLDIEPFDDAGFENYSKKGSLGELWRTNPMVKIGALLAGLALVVGAVILFGGKEEKEPPSYVSSGSDVSEAPGTSEISATMEQAIKEKNMERVEQAAMTGQSAIPIPTQSSKSVMPLPEDTVPEEDAFDRWRRMQEERLRQQQVMEQAVPPVPPVEEPAQDTRTPAVNAMAQAMSGQMQSILQNQPQYGVNHKEITNVMFLQQKEEEKNTAAMKEREVGSNRYVDGMTGTLTNEQEQVEDIIIPAGTIEYGQLLMEANTDAPGPVLAQIVSGPLRGARVLGSFSSTDEYLVLNFSMVVIDGIDYPVQAVAIDPETTLPGVITEIDRRYFKRIVLPMAASFVEGLTNAISESGTTSVFISDSNVTQSTEDKDSRQEVASGVSEAGQTLKEILDEEADSTQPMLRVAAGTPLGILFVMPVVDTGLSSR